MTNRPTRVEPRADMVLLVESARQGDEEAIRLIKSSFWYRKGWPPPANNLPYHSAIAAWLHGWKPFGTQPLIPEDDFGWHL